MLLCTVYRYFKRKKNYLFAILLTAFYYASCVLDLLTLIYYEQ